MTTPHKKLTIKTNAIKKIPWVFGSHAFLVILFLIFLDLVFGVLFFYNYFILVTIQSAKVNDTIVQFEYGNYQKILNQWQTKDQNLQQSLDTKYINPFTKEPPNPGK